MHPRPGRSLAVACVAVASVGALGVATASAAPTGATAAPAKSTGPASTPAGKPWGRALDTLAAPSTSTTASTRMAPAYGGYPLRVSTLTTKVVSPLQLSVSKKYGVLV